MVEPSGIPADGVYSGTWGYNPCLVGIAIGGVFFVPHGTRFLLVWLAAVVTSVVLHGAVSSGLAPVGLPPLCLPASITCIAFCLLAGAARDVVAVNLAAITVPVRGGACIRLVLQPHPRTHMRDLECAA